MGLQALGKLAENDVLIKTRKVDQGIVKEVLEEAKKKYKDIFGQDSPTIKLNEKEFLPPPPSSAENVDEEDNWWDPYLACHNADRASVKPHLAHSTSQVVSLLDLQHELHDSAWCRGEHEVVALHPSALTRELLCHCDDNACISTD